jgi:putative heme-binding domain-containing protein
LPEIVSAALDTALSREERVKALAAIQSLGPRAKAADERSSVPKLAALLSDADESIASAAVAAIGAFRTDDAVSTLKRLVIENGRPVEFRREAVRAMSATKSGSSLLLTMAERRELPQEFVLDATELLHSSPHQDIRLMAHKVLPRPITSEGAQLPPLEVLLAMPGDASRGKAAFFSDQRAQCGRCHVVNGEGKGVGPDLSVIGQKLSRQSFFESILNPSAAVAPEYKVWVLNTEDEGYLTGFIRSETAEAVELMDSNGNAVRINPASIIDRTPSDASLMPNGLTAALTAQELADIVAYLESLR